MAAGCSDRHASGATSEVRNDEDVAAIVHRQQRSTGRQLGDTILASLRLRRFVQAVDAPEKRTWLDMTDSRLRHTLAAWCGNPIHLPEGTVDVFATPIEQLFPVDNIAEATSAFCGGLNVGGRTVLGAAWRYRH